MTKPVREERVTKLYANFSSLSLATAIDNTVKTAALARKR